MGFQDYTERLRQEALTSLLCSAKTWMRTQKEPASLFPSKGSLLEPVFGPSKSFSTLRIPDALGSRDPRRLVPHFSTFHLRLSWHKDATDDATPRGTASQAWACEGKALLWVPSHSVGPGRAPFPRLLLAKGVSSNASLYHACQFMLSLPC